MGWDMDDVEQKGRNQWVEGIPAMSATSDFTGSGVVVGCAVQGGGEEGGCDRTANVGAEAGTGSVAGGSPGFGRGVSIVPETWTGTVSGPSWNPAPRGPG